MTELVDSDTIVNKLLQYGDESETYTEDEERGLTELYKLIDGDPDMQPWRKYAQKNFIIMGLRACNLDAKLSFKSMKKLHLHATKTYPDLFSQIDPLNLETVIRQDVLRVVKREVDEGPAIVVVRLKNWDPTVPGANIEQLALAGSLYIYAVARMSPEIQRQGIIEIIDVSGFKMVHARQVSMDLIKKAIKLYSTVPPMIKGIVYVRNLYLFEQTYKFFKWMLPPRIRKIVHITKNDMSVVTKLVDPDRLPKEFGGNIPDEEAYYEGIVDQILGDKQIFQLIKYLQDEFTMHYGLKRPSLKRRRSSCFPMA